MLPPIEVDGAAKEEVSVGQTLNVITKNVTSVSTDNAEVLKVSQPSDDGSAQFNAGAEVIGAGNGDAIGVSQQANAPKHVNQISG